MATPTVHDDPAAAATAAAASGPWYVRGPWPWLLLSLLSLWVFVPGLARLPVTDRDEARYVQASRQMDRSGDPVVIRFGNEPRYHKPVAVYWLQVLARRAVAATGAAVTVVEAVWVPRLVSLIAMTAAMLIAFAWLRHLTDRTTALLSVLILMGCALVLVEARIAKTDATLLATIIAMQGALARAWQRLLLGQRVPVATWMVFWIALGLGVLVKGPPAVLVAGLTGLALILAGPPRWRLLWGIRPWFGLPIAAAMLAPWIWALAAVGEIATVADGMADDLLPKLMGGDASHGAPPGTYLLAVPLSLWPMAPLILATLPWWRRQALRPEGRFALAWAVPGWLAFELIPNKLPHYILPMLPAVTLLAALVLSTGLPAPQSRRGRLWRGAVLVLGGAVAVALPLGMGAITLLLAAAPPALHQPALWAPLAVAAVLALAAAALWLLGQGGIGARPGRAHRDAQRIPAGRAIALAVVLLAALGPVASAALGHWLPALTPLWPGPAVSAAVAAVDPARSRGLVVEGYSEPSLFVALDRPFCTTVEEAEPCPHLSPLGAPMPGAVLAAESPESAARRVAAGPGTLALLAVQGQIHGEPKTGADPGDGAESGVVRRSTEIDRFLRALGPFGLTARPIWDWQGINTARTDQMRAVLFEVTPPALPFCARQPLNLARAPLGPDLMGVHARLCRAVPADVQSPDAAPGQGGAPGGAPGPERAGGDG